MFKSRTASFSGLVIAFLMYIGVCGYLLKQEPAPTLPAYKSCEESCTTRIEFYVPEAAKRMTLARELDDIFESYTAKDVGYFVYWNGDVCELRLYANSPNALLSLTSKLEAQVAPFIENRTHHIIEVFDGITYSLLSRI